MKIEFGFQANCSELVTYLGAKSREEIISAMTRIAEATGWTWRVSSNITVGDQETKKSRLCYSLLIPTQFLDRLLVVDYEEKNFGVDPRDLSHIWREQLSLEIIRALRKLSDSCRVPPGEKYSVLDLHDIFELANLSSDQPVVVEVIAGSQQKPWATLSLDILYEERREFNIWIDSIAIEKMPILHRIRKLFPAGFSMSSEGRSYPYRTWMCFHYLDRERAIGKLGIPKHETERLRKAVQRLEDNPPLPGSGELDEEELRAIEEIL